nr:hypothetical protein BaRGS_005274 [Batillaria attramentaria]
MTQPLGLRVLRGPDWDRGDEDGGEGHVGTVIELLSNHTVLVLWDTGQESTCRAGTDGKFDLRIFDTAQIAKLYRDAKSAFDFEPWEHFREQRSQEESTGFGKTKMAVYELTEGATVRIRPDEDEVKVLNSRTIGKTGRVLKIDNDGDAVVAFGLQFFMFSPACCLPAGDGAKPDSLTNEAGNEKSDRGSIIHNLAIRI